MIDDGIMSANTSTQAARELATKTYFLLLQDAAKSVPQQVQTNLSYCIDVSLMVKRKRERVDVLLQRLLNPQVANSVTANDLSVDERTTITKELCTLLSEISAIRGKEALTLQATAAHIDDASSQLDEAYQRGEQYFRRPTRRAVEKDAADAASSLLAASARAAAGVNIVSGDVEKPKRSPAKPSRREASTSATRNRGVLKKQKLDKEHRGRETMSGGNASKLNREKKLARLKEKANNAARQADRQTSPSSPSSVERGSKNALVEAVACITSKKLRVPKQARASARSAKLHGSNTLTTPPSRNSNADASERLSVYDFGPTTPPISPPGALDALRAAAHVIGQLSSSTATTSGDEDGGSAASSATKRKPRRNVSATARQASTMSSVSAPAPAAATSSNSTMTSPAYDRKISSTSEQTKRDLAGGSSSSSSMPIISSSSTSTATTRSPGTPTDAPPQPPINERRALEQTPFSSVVKSKYVRRKLKDVTDVKKSRRDAIGSNAKPRRGDKPLSPRKNAAERKADRNANMPFKRHSSDDRNTVSAASSVAPADHTSATHSSREASPTLTNASSATTTLTSRGTVRKQRRSAAPGGGAGRRPGPPSGRKRRQSGTPTATEVVDSVVSGKESAESSGLPPSRRKTMDPKFAVKTEADQQATTYTRPHEVKLSKRPSPKDESPDVAMVAVTTTTTKSAARSDDSAPYHPTSAGGQDEEKFCYCKQISYGQMVACDNSTCKVEWFHFECVGLKATPRGKWYCPDCRGDKPHVLKNAAGTSSRKASVASGGTDEDA